MWLPWGESADCECVDIYIKQCTNDTSQPTAFRLFWGQNAEFSCQSQSVNMCVKDCRTTGLVVHLHWWSKRLIMSVTRRLQSVADCKHFVSKY